MRNATRNLSMAGAALGLVLTAGGGAATAQAEDPANRMDLAEFYAVRAGDYRPGVEAECGCTGQLLDRWLADGMPHKRVLYRDHPGLKFRVDYVRPPRSGVWTVDYKAIQADGFVFPFRSNRSS